MTILLLLGLLSSGLELQGVAFLASPKLLMEIGNLLAEVGGDGLASRGPSRGEGLEENTVMIS